MNSISTSPKISHSELNQSLEDAVHSRDIEKLARLLDIGADPAARSGKAFFLAATSNFSQGAKLLFERHAGKDDTLSRLLDTAFIELKKNHAPLCEAGRMLIAWGARIGVDDLFKSLIKELAGPLIKTNNHDSIAFLCRHSESKELLREVWRKAATHGHLNLVKFLTRTEIASTNWLRSAIDDAANYGHLHIVKFLCRAGADSASRTQALHSAKYSRHFDIINFLCRSGADVAGVFDSLCFCDSRYSKDPKRLDVLKYLLQNGAGNVTHYDDLLMEDAAGAGRLDIVRLLCEQSRVESHRRESSLSMAAEHGHLKIVQFLVEQGVDPGGSDNSSFLRAAREGHTAVVSFLWEVGANITADTINSALVRAVNKGHTGVATFLRELGGTLSVNDANNALCSAASRGDIAMFTLLRDAGADISSAKAKALENAVNNSQHPMIDLLCQLGADVTVDNNSLIKHAVSKGSLKTVESLCKYGADVSVDDNKLISDAAAHKQQAILEVLATYGADVTARDNTPIRSAGKENDLCTVQYLLREYPDAILSRFDCLPDYLEVDRNTVAQRFLLAQFKSYFLKTNPLAQRLRDALSYKSAADEPDYFDRLLSLVVTTARTLSNTPATQAKLSKQLFRTQLARFERAAEKNTRFSFSDAFEQLLADAKQLPNLKDVVKRVACEVILPRLAQASDIRDVDALEKIAYSSALEAITATRDVRDLIRLNRFMHTPIATLPAYLLPYKTTLSWPPLFTEPIQLSDELHIVALSSQQELVAEGKALAHCVGDGTRASECSSGKKQILSLRKNGACLATIELSRAVGSNYSFSSSRNRRWLLTEYKEYKNRAAGDESKAGWQAFIDLVGKGQIIFNPVVSQYDGSSLQGFDSFVSKLERKTGIPNNEPELLDKIAKHYLMLAEKFGEPIFHLPTREGTADD